MARPKYQARLDDVVDRAVDVGLDAMFDRVTSFFEKQVATQAATQRAAVAGLPADARRAPHKCAGCHQVFPMEDMHMVSPHGTGWGVCDPCLRFMHSSAKEKTEQLKQGIGDFAKNVARNTAQGQPRRPAQPKGPTPWEVLGIDADASTEEVKKAYRRNAAVWHPDRVPPGSSAEDHAKARDRFEEVDRAYKAMMKVRSPAT